MHLLQSPLQDHRPFHQKAIGLGRALPLIAFFLATLLLANALQLLSPLLLPFSRKTFRAYNRFCAGSWWQSSVWIAEHICHYKLKIQGDELPNNENAIVICNHQEMPDILLLLMLGAQKKQIGNLKWFAKNMIKYVPGVGWGMVFLDCIFLKRNWAADRSLIQASFAKYLREKIPFWLILFPEGTRLRKHKLKRAAEFAASRGLRPPRHVLLPKPRGFAAALTGLRSEIRAVYDVTIAYNGGVPTLMQLLNGAATGARMNVRRFPVEMLPTDEREIAEWLRIRFVEKDQLLSELLQQDPGI